MTDYGTNPALSLQQPFFGGERGLARFGLPELPGRAPSPALRKLYSVERAKREIDRCGTEALTEARARLAQHIEAQASGEVLLDAQQVVDFLRHSRGPKFQVAMLLHCGHPNIEVIHAKDQTPYERVYEVSMAVASAIYAQTGIAIRKAMAALEARVGTSEEMAQWAALAETFLSNTPTQNYNLPVLRRVEELIDAYGQNAMREFGGDPQRAAQAVHEAREDVARRIRAGDIDLIEDI